MKTNNRWALNALLFIAVAFSSMAHAALVGRLAATSGGTDYQAYYDTNANLTWLADANYAKTNGYDTDGAMRWADAKVWAAGLTIDGVTGWRLPDPNPSSCFSYNSSCTNADMGNLFYTVLGGIVSSSIVTTHNANYKLFSNIQNSDYWSATGLNASQAWLFGMHGGGPDYDSQAANFYAWAVHSGDVKSLVPVVSAVPVPAAVWLFGSGLLGLIGLAKRKTLRLAV